MKYSYLKVFRENIYFPSLLFFYRKISIQNYFHIKNLYCRQFVDQFSLFTTSLVLHIVKKIFASL